MSIENVDTYINTQLTDEEEILRGVIISARQVQTMLWGGANGAWGLEEWRRMFRKRVAKIDAIKEDNPHAHIELKKRLLQTAALAVALINVVDVAGAIPKRDDDAPESNLPEFTNVVNPVAGQVCRKCGNHMLTLGASCEFDGASCVAKKGKR